MKHIKETILKTTEDISYKSSIYKEKALKCFNLKDEIFENICIYNKIEKSNFKPKDLKNNFNDFLLKYNDLLDVFSMSIHNEITENKDFLLNIINSLENKSINHKLLKINSIFLIDFIELGDNFHKQIKMVEKLKKHFLEIVIIEEIKKDLKKQGYILEDLFDFYTLQEHI